MKYATNPLQTHLIVMEVLPDGETVYRYVNETFAKRRDKNLRLEDFIGKRYSEAHTPEESKIHNDALVRVIESGKPYDHEYLSPRGGYFKRTVTPHTDETGRKYVTIVSSNIDEIKGLQQKLEDAAYHDTLTGLANRRLLADRARLAMADLNRDRHDNGHYYTCVGILKMDLDNFKYNNDTHGHAYGDELLVEVAKRLSDCVRSIDTVAREGGDEFTLLLPKTTQEGTVVVAKKVIDEINRSYNINNIECSLGVSVGISFYPQDGAALEELLRKADQVLYLAKQEGKNTYRVYDEVKDKVSLSKGYSNR